MIRSDKEVKREFKGKASAHPDNYYATAILKREGYERKQCTCCGTFFWTVNPQQTVCGDPTCSGGFRLFNNNPSKQVMTYTQTWQNLAQHFAQRGYRIMNRYPVVARWNPTVDFTIASIAAFQPHVISGEVEPPAKKLLIPQFCLRFGDIDNVGITGSHLTGFIMVGQHMFVPPEEWNQNQAFLDLYDWFRNELGLPKEELTFHEDAWAGGGNFGPCMEFFSRGVELCNQVYMLYEQTPEGDKGLNIKVLDMGLGLERCAWFSQGKGTAYDATFPSTLQKIYERTNEHPNIELQKKFLPKASYLNIDEVDNIQEAWDRVAQEINVPTNTLREAIEPMQAIYSIAEHARSLLFALNDGGLPSNVGGGYNLRTIYRRAQGFIEKYNWQLDMGEVTAWHAQELQDLFPELQHNITDIQRILAVEKEKHNLNKQRGVNVIEQAIKKSKQEGQTQIPLNKLIELYDSNGINPDIVAKEAKKHGINITIPDNFYQLVSERHEKQEQATATKKSLHFPIDDLQRTEQLYLQDYKIINFQARILRIIDQKNIVLDKTAFYPTSGGQEHDIGTITGSDNVTYNVIDIIKQGGIIIHILEEAPDLEEGETITGKIDWNRREQLSQHHTATHIINGAARKVLGPHIWQAGAAKTEEKGRIDITHYASLTDEEIQHIEDEANSIIAQKITLQHALIPKREAEEQHGFRLYQGGAVPGKQIRVVNIPGFDVEACGGTHLNNTQEAGVIKILKATKIQDGIIRLEYVAGKKAQQLIEQRKNQLQEIQTILNTKEEYIPSVAEALFQTWKKARKGTIDKTQESTPVAYHGDILAKTAEILQTQQENIIPTIKRFQKDIAATSN